MSYYGKEVMAITMELMAPGLSSDVECMGVVRNEEYKKKKEAQ